LKNARKRIFERHQPARPPTGYNRWVAGRGVGWCRKIRPRRIFKQTLNARTCGVAPRPQGLTQGMAFSRHLSHLSALALLALAASGLNGCTRKSDRRPASR
jgi:hypothetical protein